MNRGSKGHDMPEKSPQYPVAMFSAFTLIVSVGRSQWRGAQSAGGARSAWPVRMVLSATRTSDPPKRAPRRPAKSLTGTTQGAGGSLISKIA